MRAFANIQLQVRPGDPGAVVPRILKAFSLESLRIPAPSYPAIAASACNRAGFVRALESIVPLFMCGAD